MSAGPQVVGKIPMLPLMTKIKDLLQSYDQDKGRFRRIGVDAKLIRDLRKLFEQHQKQAVNDPAQHSPENLQAALTVLLQRRAHDFAKPTHEELSLSEQIFRELAAAVQLPSWQMEQLITQAMREAIQAPIPVAHSGCQALQDCNGTNAFTLANGMILAYLKTDDQSTQQARLISQKVYQSNPHKYITGRQASMTWGALFAVIETFEDQPFKESYLAFKKSKAGHLNEMFKEREFSTLNPCLSPSTQYALHRYGQTISGILLSAVGKLGIAQDAHPDAQSTSLPSNTSHADLKKENDGSLRLSVTLDCSHLFQSEYLNAVITYKNNKKGTVTQTMEVGDYIETTEKKLLSGKHPALYTAQIECSIRNNPAFGSDGNQPPVLVDVTQCIVRGLPASLKFPPNTVVPTLGSVATTAKVDSVSTSTYGGLVGGNGSLNATTTVTAARTATTAENAATTKPAATTQHQHSSADTSTNGSTVAITSSAHCAEAMYSTSHHSPQANDHHTDDVAAAQQQAPAPTEPRHKF